MSIERILSKNNIEHKPVGASYQIRCLSPDHVDNNPSMFVNKYSGWANCRSCGVSYNLFELFNEKPNWLSVKKELFREKMRKVASDTNYLEFPDTSVFWVNSYRGISAETIKKFQAFQCSEFPGYICFPIKDANGNIINFIGRDTSGTRTPKYLFFHKKPVVMYPVTKTSLDSVILVEGIFDVLNLYDKGITNVRSIFGTTTFTDKHLDRLKIEGISEVVLMLDSDQAGKEGTAKIKTLLEDNYINTKVVTLPSGRDPGELTLTEITKIKELLYGKSSNSGDKAV